ncbi:MAG: PAS domain S-box protein [Bacteroidota bacterium]
MSEPLSRGPSENDTRRSREELLSELTSLRRQYVNLKILEYEHERALGALRESEERYRQIVETATDIIYRISPRGYFTYANPVAVRIIGFSLKEIIGKNYLDLVQPEYRKKTIRHYLEQTTQRIPSTYFEFPATSKDGSIVWLGQNVQIVVRDNEIVELQAVARDITEKRKEDTQRQHLELQLLQAQKMESIGRLAGGIAHDFNNILGIILAYANILENRNLPGEKVRMSLDAITRAIQRAKAMVRELLTLARKTEPSLEYVDVNESIRDFSRMIMETFPKSIAFSMKYADQSPGILADLNQFHQVLLNLLVNARDAMPRGGTLEIVTRTVPAESMKQGHPDARNVPYAAISVKDTGIGMDEQTRARVFEPFFSTKEHGKGSGLGLAVVYGIVQGHGGYVGVESSPGEGATFDLYFPTAEGTRKDRTAQSDQAPLNLAGTETILFVEDEEMLKDAITTVLKEMGYIVLVAGDGIEAVELFMKQQNEISLVLSDLGLPRLGGWEACVTMREINARVRVVVASGFIDPALREEIVKTGAAIVQKPYEPSEVLRTVRRVLNAEASS